MSLMSRRRAVATRHDPARLVYPVFNPSIPGRRPRSLLVVKRVKAPPRKGRLRMEDQSKICRWGSRARATTPRSLAVVTLPPSRGVSSSPWTFTQRVDAMPSSRALAFIISTNPSTEPPMCSATATQASLAEEMTMAAIISDRGKTSPCCR